MIIYAINLHAGGGKVLLDTILTESLFNPLEAIFIDERYPLPIKLPPEVAVIKVRPTIWGRFTAEFQLHSLIKKLNLKSSSVLFFGNLPPIKRTGLKSFLYLQNCYLTGEIPLPNDSFKQTLRLTVEKWILRTFANNVDEIWVQTAWMKQICEKIFSKQTTKIHLILPKFPNVQVKAKKYKFITISSFSTHKRLSFFTDALKLLDKDLNQSINVVIILDVAIAGALVPINFENINLTVKYKISREELATLLLESETFVATSLYESLYLPLYEAAHYKLNLIAPDAGYTIQTNLEISKYPQYSLNTLVALMKSKIYV
ncbi:MAG: glycosyltransferase [Bdellovibrionota bacterium]